MIKYVLGKLDNPRDIIIIVRDPKDPYAHINMDNPNNLSKEYKEYVILITQLQEEAKYYVKRVWVLKNTYQNSMFFYGTNVLLVLRMKSKGTQIIIKIQTQLINFV